MVRAETRLTLWRSPAVKNGESATGKAKKSVEKFSRSTSAKV
jgi:hypothetical protein